MKLKSYLAAKQFAAIRRMPILAIALTLTAASLPEAKAYYDDFDRAELGPNWSELISSIQPTIGNSYLLSPTEPVFRAPFNAWSNVVALTQFNEFELTPSFEIQSQIVLGWSTGGVAFNIQDADNFYFLYTNTDGSFTRFGFGQYVNGVSSELTGNYFVGDGGLDSLIEYSVSTTGGGEFTGVIRDLNGDTLGSIDYTFSDYVGGGYSGFYVRGSILEAANFQVIPEPSTAVLLLSSFGAAACVARFRRFKG